MTFTKTHTAKRGTSTYKSDEGVVIYVPKSAGEHPDLLEIEGLTAPAKTAKTAAPKLSKEERQAALAAEKARVAALSPEEKAAEARAKAEAKRVKAAADLQAAEERLRKIQA